MQGLYSFLDKNAQPIIAMLRIITGLQFLAHGMSKLIHWPDAVDFATLPVFSLVWIAGVLEVIFGPLIIIGWYSRVVAFLAAGEMAIGYFIKKLPHGFVPETNDGDVAVCFCFIFLALAAIGPGSWSINRK